jgi:hypothetical protein
MVIEPSKSPSIRDINGSKDLNELVGGWLGAAPFPPQFSAFINEDGKSLELPVNMLATYLCNTLGLGLFPGDQINGTMVILGPVDNEGNETDLPSETIDLINKEIANSFGNL